MLAQIDPQSFEYRVASAQADVDAARAVVLTAQANGHAGRAALSRAQVDLAEAQRDLERKQSLVEKQFIAQSEADKARALVNTSSEAVKVAQAQLGVSEAQAKSAQAGVAQREAALAQARIDLARTRITSPVNGIVIKRAIDKGQTVAASLASPELFVIAQNLSDMQVDASIDETDVGRIRAGQAASFTVDAFPGQTFSGQVRQVRLAPTTVASVVTYVAVIGFANNAGRLLPGMTANVRVITDVRDQVLKVPNAALRVRIAGLEPPAGAASGAVGGGRRAGAPAVAGSNAMQTGAIDVTPARARGPNDAQPRAAGRPRGRIYLMGADGKPMAVNVRLGISDGSSTELLLGQGGPNAANATAATALKEGAQVIVGVLTPGTPGVAGGGSGRGGANGNAGPRPAF